IRGCSTRRARGFGRPGASSARPWREEGSGRAGARCGGRRGSLWIGPGGGGGGCASAATARAGDGRRGDEVALLGELDLGPAAIDDDVHLPLHRLDDPVAGGFV